MILSKVIIGIVTFLIAMLAIAVDNKKNNKITKWGWTVFLLLTVLAGFTIYSDVSKELSENKEKAAQQKQEIELANKREKEYQEYISYLSTLTEKSEKTLSKFDSSAIIQSILLSKAQQTNIELERAKQLQNEIHDLSATSLKSLSKSISELEVLKQTQGNTIAKLDTLNQSTEKNIKSLTSLSNDIDNLNMPISPFKIILKFKASFDDTSLIAYSKRVSTQHKLFANPLGRNDGKVDYFIGFPLFGKDMSLVRNYQDFRNYMFDINQQMFVSLYGIEYDYEYEGLPELFHLNESDNSIWFNVSIVFKKVKSNNKNYKNLKELFEKSLILLEYFRYVSEQPFILLLNKNEKKNVLLSKIEFQPEIKLCYGKSMEFENTFSLPMNSINQEKWIKVDSLKGYKELRTDIGINLGKSFTN